MGNRTYSQMREKERLPLRQAQTLKVTRSGLPINPQQNSKLMSRRQLDKMRRSSTISPDVRIILNPPFSEMDRITDNLYLTGVAGLIEENITSLRITCIINATFEMPLISIRGIDSYRVPVDDDLGEDILLYFDDVSNVIQDVSKKGGRTVVHCMAGASRSSTLVIAYLIKYHEYTLKNAFCYVKSLRSCARPNISFFSQLIEYEKFYRSEVSVELIEILKDGKIIKVPDFYQSMFPDLYKAELNRQFYRSHISKIKLQDSNKNYINRKRNFLEIQKDIQNLVKRNYET